MSELDETISRQLGATLRKIEIYQARMQALYGEGFYNRVKYIFILVSCILVISAINLILLAYGIFTR